MKKIDISTTKYPNKFAIVDDNAPKEVFIFKWGYFKNGYVRRNDKGKTRLLHKVILKTNKIVDHINRDTLDNRRENLRISDKSKNAFNTGLWRHNKSGYKGVSWDNENKKWRVSIQIEKRSINLGRYNSIREAVIARKIAVDKFLPVPTW